MTSFLHIYAQDTWHCEAFIIGNTEGLINLRNAIDSAIEKTKGKASCFVNDGEGFDVHVIKEDEFFNELVVPYTDIVAREIRQNGKIPSLFHKEKLSKIDSRAS